MSTDSSVVEVLPQTSNDKAMNEAIHFVVDSLKEMKEFTLDQLPDVLIQMVHYHMVMSWMGVIVGVTFLSISIYLIIRTVKSDFKGWQSADRFGHGGPSSVSFFSLLAFFFCTFVGAGMLLANLPMAIQTTWFSKWFIVQRLLEMTN